MKFIYLRICRSEKRHKLVCQCAQFRKMCHFASGIQVFWRCQHLMSLSGDATGPTPSKTVNARQPKNDKSPGDWKTSYESIVLFQQVLKGKTLVIILHTVQHMDLLTARSKLQSCRQDCGVPRGVSLQYAYN